MVTVIVVCRGKKPESINFFFLDYRKRKDYLGTKHCFGLFFHVCFRTLVVGGGKVWPSSGGGDGGGGLFYSCALRRVRGLQGKKLKSTIKIH
jgi:hypothetical protein